MKMKKFLISKTPVALFWGLVILIGSASAQPLNGPDKKSSAEPLTVKYEGVDGDYLLFEITVNTTDVKRPELRIIDENTGPFYLQTLTSGEQVEKIKIEKKDEQNLSFELTAGKDTYNKSFAVNTCFTEKTTVTETEVVSNY
jgi:hypothetical protein